MEIGNFEEFIEKAKKEFEEFLEDFFEKSKKEFAEFLDVRKAACCSEFEEGVLMENLMDVYLERRD